MNPLVALSLPLAGEMSPEVTEGDGEASGGASARHSRVRRSLSGSGLPGRTHLPRPGGERHAADPPWGMPFGPGIEPGPIGCPGALLRRPGRPGSSAGISRRCSRRGACRHRTRPIARAGEGAVGLRGAAPHGRCPGQGIDASRDTGGRRHLPHRRLDPDRITRPQDGSSRQRPGHPQRAGTDP